MNNAGSNLIWFIIGVLLINIGIRGNLGATIAALLVPSALQDNSNGQ